MRNRPTVMRWVTRLALAATTASIGVVAAGAVMSPASADTPVKVGWWNFASGGGVAAPAPDTSAGGLRVGVSSSQTLAIGAVEYRLPADGSATMELAITAITSNSNAPVLNAIFACPTKDDSWKAGDDQDSSTAPAYDCDARHFVGHLSADQSTMTFEVDGSADLSDGVLSLAIVPAHSTAIPEVGTDPGTGTDLTAPFVVDFDKPGTNSFVPDDSSSTSSSDGSSSAPPPPATTGSGSTGSSTTTPSFPAPPATGAVSVPPATGDTGAGASPVVAPQQQAATGGAAPAAAIAPAKTDNTKHDLLLVLLILLLFGILYTQNMQQRAPRRLAGAQHGAATGGDTAAALPVPYPAAYAPRGLGRFAKPRTESARPLI